MPRNGSGTYTLPQAPFVPQTRISSTAMNSDLSDISGALTGSLARSGEGGMTAVLPMANAGWNYLSDPDTGMSRFSANVQVITCGGVNVVVMSTSGVTIPVPFDATAITQRGNPIIMIGEVKLWPCKNAPPLWVFCGGQELLRASYPDLWTLAQSEIALGTTAFGNGNGTTTFTVPDLRGRSPIGRDNMGGTAAGRIDGSMVTTPDIVGGFGGVGAITLGLSQIPAGITSVNPGAIGLSVVSTSSTIHFGGTSDNYTSVAGSGQFNNISRGAQTSTGTITASGVAVTSNNTGGTSHLNVQPSLVVNYIIYAGA